MWRETVFKFEYKPLILYSKHVRKPGIYWKILKGKIVLSIRRMKFYRRFCGFGELYCAMDGSKLKIKYN